MKLKTFFTALALLALATLNLSAAMKSFTVEFDGNDFEVRNGDVYSWIVFDGDDYFYQENFGEPQLPKKLIRLAVPDGAQFTGLDYTFETEAYDDEIFVNPMQYFRNSDESYVPPKIDPNEAIYNSNSPYPEELVEHTSTQLMSSYRFMTFAVSPFVYYPQSRELKIIKKITVTVNYNTGDTRDTERWDDGTFLRLLSDFVINPADLVPGGIIENPEEKKSKQNSTMNGDDDYDYLIITSSGLVDDFQELADWREMTGFNTKILAVEDIYSTYSGSTNQLKIKSCIEDYYENHGTMWVLLGGDNTIVPDQDTYGNVNNGGYTTSNLPADLFYACFDNQFDWDANGNGIAGETGDNIDMAPEVILTRAAIRTAAHVEAFADKSINYEKNPPESDFAEKMLLTGEQLWYTWGGRSDADWRNERMWDEYIDPYWDGQRWRLYDTNTDFGGASYDLTPGHLSDQINDGYNYLHMATHGNTTIWAMESGGHFSSSHASNLTNQDQQGIIVTNACITNAFDSGTDPCLSEAFLRNPKGGAIGYFGCSRYGWGYAVQSDILGPSMMFDAVFFESLFKGEPNDNAYKLGAVAAEAKAKILGMGYADGYGAYRWLMFGINMLGDPGVDLLDADPEKITANHNRHLIMGDDEASVSFCNAPDALATLFFDGELIGQVELQSGNGTIEFDPLAKCNQDATITITEHNYEPYSADIPVYALPAPTLLSPDNNSVAVPVDGQFTWEEVANADFYRIQVSENEDMSAPVIDMDNVTEESYDYTALKHNTDYYWQVNATNENGTSLWSQKWNMKTVIAPPELDSPTDGAPCQLTDGRLAWMEVDGADKYRIVISENEDMSSPIIDMPDITNLHYDYTGFEFFTNYYWQVNATNAEGTSEWSEKFNFSTTLDKPVQTYPNEGAIAIVTNDYLKWEAVAGADEYQVQIDTDELFGSPDIDDIAQINEFMLDGVDYLVDYYWRVKAVNENCESEWSQARMFTTTPEPPFIVEHTESGEVCLGGGFPLEVVATGRVIQYQWEKDGVPIRGAVEGAYFGLDDCRFHDAGVYRCKLTNVPGADVVYTDPIVLFVGGDTEIQEHPQSVYTTEGANLHFTFRAHTRGLPPDYQPEIQWYKGDQPLVENERITGVDASILNINGVLPQDFADNYHVELLGFCGDLVVSEDFGIFEADVIETQPADLTVCENESASFTIGIKQLQAGQTADYQWYKDGNTLSDDGNITGVNSGTLNIANADDTHAGSYHVEITVQPDGFVNVSNPAQLAIDKAPVILTQPEETISVETDRPFSLYAEADGSDPLNYAWYKDGSVLSETSNSLTVAAAQTTDAGEYWCVVSNHCGDVESQHSTVAVTFMGIMSVDESRSGGFILYANSPNPFSGETTIEFYAPESSHVRLTVTDMFGREIAELFNGSANKGKTTVTWNAVISNVASGVLYYNLVSGNNRITKQMVIVK